MGIWRGVSTIRPVVAGRADLPANASAAAAAVLFGASVVAVRVAVRDVPPMSLAVLRIGQGGLLLTGLLGAVYGQVAKRVLKVDSAATVTTYAMLVGALVLLPAAVVEG